MENFVALVALVVMEERKRKINGDIPEYFEYENSNIVSVKIPQGTRVIGYSSFIRCVNLVTVEILSGTKVIQDAAFEGCSSLKEVTLPEGLELIESRAFEDCVSLKTITLPKGLKTIYYCAFLDCTSLESVEIPDGVTFIGWQVFGGCTSLKSITVPDSVTTGWCENGLRADLHSEAFDPHTTVLVRMSWSLENFKRCDKPSKERIFTVLMCLHRLEIPTIPQRTILGFLSLTRDFWD